MALPGGKWHDSGDDDQSSPRPPGLRQGLRNGGAERMNARAKVLAVVLGDGQDGYNARS